MKKYRYFIISILINAVLIAVFSLIIGIFCIDVYKFDSVSQNPNYSMGSYVVIDNLSYLLKSPKAGDMVAFSQDGVRIKRIIGVPGDKVEVINGNLYINMKKCEETYIRDEYIPGNVSIYVPAGYYFVLNDNREEMDDSRQGYLVSEGNISGKGIIFSDDIKQYFY